MIGVVDYKAGNIQSIRHILNFLRLDYRISDNPKDLEKASQILFPGVGNASYAMKQLAKTGFDSFLKERTAAGVPLLGICLGSQIIFEYSEEEDTACLGLLKGNVRHFKNAVGFDKSLKIPHMGWNDIRYTNNTDSLFNGIPEHSDFYFVHSYFIQPQDESIVSAYTAYGTDIPAAVQANNIRACQFHPEKSGAIGLRILQNFARQNA